MRNVEISCKSQLRIVKYLPTAHSAKEREFHCSLVVISLLIHLFRHRSPSTCESTWVKRRQGGRKNASHRNRLILIHHKISET